MGISKHVLVVLSSLALVSRAHFLLKYPETIGFDDDKEGDGPCGGYDVSFDKVTSWSVGGDAIALQSTHPVAQWLFRATLDKTAASGWVNLRPEITQNGLGYFCDPGVTVPENWAGQQGVIQVIQDAADGQLYQCAAVNFVSGAAASLPSDCKNVTGLTASYASSSAVSGIPAATTVPLPTGATSTAPGAAATTTGAASKMLGSADGYAILGAGLGLLGFVL